MNIDAPEFEMILEMILERLFIKFRMKRTHIFNKRIVMRS